jgi:hypothetical protein
LDDENQEGKADRIARKAQFVLRAGISGTGEATRMLHLKLYTGGG